ncbi:retrovirus-related Pol polyprotein from transposon TNT 1-94 [Trichonephila clavipes]|nr:retrovirus-related Pol polyprotein from transposon TNT 1-94 [Trichonephila clavipes]
MDVCGPLPVVSCGRAKYFLSITDDFSRMVTCFPLKEKSQVFEYFKSFQANAERVLNRKILSVRCDNGMELCHSKFSKHLNELGIRCERTNTYSDYDDPDKSGKAVVGDSSRVNTSNLKLGSSIPFYREAILHQNGKRYDIYYCIKDNYILYDKSLFDFNSTVDHNTNRPEASNIEVLIPRHFKDAKNSPQPDKWQDAMKEEINVMKERYVWELVSTPQDSKVIGCRWV